MSGNGEGSFIAAIRRKEEIEGAPKSMGTADRIALEKKLGILRRRFSELEEATAEQWQREMHLEKIEQKRALQEEITRLENRLLDA
jgi:hypothetical protein